VIGGSSQPPAAGDPRPIGVFDSGVGGLTVLRAIHERLPHERLVYLGDTARLPYGTKSPETVARYARQAAAVLVDRGVKLLVIACNTASAVALEDLQRHFAPLPVVGVVQPGAAAACAASRERAVAVIGTDSTIAGGAYTRAIARIDPEVRVQGLACPVFVALAEEGWTDGPVADAAVARYLRELIGAGPAAFDTLVLGCTHFPVLRAPLARALGPGVTLVDSAEPTAAEVEAVLAAAGRLARAVDPRVDAAAGEGLQFLATDGPRRFARVGAVFLARPIDPQSVELVDL
jgi:glutamate racemase